MPVYRVDCDFNEELEDFLLEHDKEFSDEEFEVMVIVSINKFNEELREREKKDITQHYYESFYDISDILIEDYGFKLLEEKSVVKLIPSSTGFEIPPNVSDLMERTLGKISEDPTE